MFIDERIIVVKILINKCELQNSTISLTKNQPDKSEYKWTAKITDLVELIYAIYYVGCINDGNVTLKQIVSVFEKMFKIKIPNSSHTFNKNCERIDQTPFMQKLLNTLISKISERDN